jgi:molybdopterin converting factor small subunit
MGQAHTVTVEFFGIPRHRARRTELTVPAGTVGEVLASVGAACPELADLVQTGGRLSPDVVLSVDGTRFGADLDQALAPGARLLLFSADAGG